VLPDSRFNSVESMRIAVFFDGPEARNRYSRFWLLLVLSAVIASAGIVGDSTATVIGAMIVAPLMTPIMGTMLSTVIGDRANLARSLLLVVAGAATAVAIGYLVGLLVVNDMLAETNSQVAARVTPRLIDLLAALGTGVVGSVALVRKDISDTLPGVAIAISLVPPLAVAGLALESGSIAQSLGALLLFVTNVVAIIGTGVVVMSVYGVTRLAREPLPGGPLPGGPLPGEARAGMGRTVALLTVMFIIVGVPLALTSISITNRALVEQTVHRVSESWASSVGWQVDTVSSRDSDVYVRIEGELPVPDTTALKAQLDAAGVDTAQVTVNLVPVYSVKLSG
jgi:uncharacterized hydrophobic protein (TIGR00271 family)